MTTTHEFYMREALKEALKAYFLGEVPVGAVIVKDAVIVARGYNMRESTQDPTLHAEIVAIRNAAKYLQSWRLVGTTLYATAEPCLMCLGSMIHSRIAKLVYGTVERKMGAVVSLYKNLIDKKGVHHHINYVSGVKEKTASYLLSRFFRELRRKTR